ncbi:hypothetical protein GH714_010198 [Hevea brasiliensis]|uniref:Ionotropic glutamate receptor C-terminal domain-containing protein n=1 Tax=Hevea brasiliensis TaxID=3981 RepID=A0A6A6KBB2_HEVBR|nr:hypothetical protein GH714_010198 [Hevea brasiliensis]
MQGIVGVKSYFPETGQCFKDFYKRFRRRFSTQHPEEDNNEPGIFAVQAYDALRTMALAINETNFGGQELLTKYHDLSGKIQFINQEVASKYTFQIINIMGKSYRELGFWSNGFGFSKTIGEGAYYTSSMNDYHVFWPGGPRDTPRGWTIRASDNPLRIGVPTNSGYTEYVNVQQDRLGNNLSFTGFAIDVFHATLERLPFYLPYKFVPFNGTSYNELVKQIHLKRLPAKSNRSLLWLSFTTLFSLTGYDQNRLRTYSSIDAYAQALKNKEIAAAFLEAPLAKVFFAKYCKGFVKVGPTYKVGGFGFAFPRGSPLLASMNEALLKVSESGKLLELENSMVASNQCRDRDIDLDDENPSLGPSCFRVLFILTGATSTLALVSYVLLKANSMLKHKSIWRLMLAVMKHWRFQKKHFTRRVSNAEIHGNSPPDALHPV